MSHVFSGSAAGYANAGWTCVIPVPSDAKFPPPAGFTGASGIDTSPDQLVAWAGTLADWSIALRMPDGVIGIDVDHYDKNGTSKRGADTLAQREAEWGPLPATWSSTARGNGHGPGPSRILFFRVPPGRYATKLGPDIDVIQRHHRYAVVAPSPHSGTGAAYKWYRPDGTLADEDEVPSPDQLAELPAEWVQHLAEGAAEAGPVPADAESGAALLDYLLADHRLPCAEADEAGRRAFAELAGIPEGSRHDTMTGHVYHVIQLGAEGHAGTGLVLSYLADRWENLTGSEGRSAEFGAMMLTAARKAAGRDIPGAYADPCLAARPLGWDAPAPGGTEALPEDALEPPRQWSPRQAWGAHLFMTSAQLDSMLARDILMRTWPGLRFAADAGTWLLRGPLKWEARKGEQAKWAVEEMFWLLPRGDKDAPEGSELLDQHKRRSRFGTNAGAGAIAGKMIAQVMSGHHPCALEMAELDQDAEILWAGGLPWDLRASGEYPMLANIDPGTPHMHTAACVPKPGPTPLWDAYLTAMWPDEADRKWALRVMSVALTGHPEKLLPILIGPTDRGKTEFMKLLMSVMGTYALKSADARLLSAADRSHASIVYALKGARLAFIDEAPRTGRLAQERLKALTGGAPLTGNRMGENPITFSPTHKLCLTANPDHEPDLTDPAVRRRTRIIPCDGDPEEIRKARAAIGFLSGPAWRAEAPAVLAMMMREAAGWLADPLTADNRAAPGKAAGLADQIAMSQDVIGNWVTDSTQNHPPGTRARELYENFVAWCKNNAVAQVPHETKWGRRLTDLGFPPDNRRDGKYRALKIRIGGGFTPSGGGFVAGSEANPPQDNASSNYPQLSTVAGVDSLHAHITHTRARTPAHTRAHATDVTFNPPHPPYPPHPQVSEGAAESKPATDPPQTRHGTAVFDLETADGDRLFTYPRGEFVRLAGITDGDGPRIVPVPELIAELERAPEISGHNILGFDLLALAWHHGADYLSLAAKARDTELIARQADPPRSRDSHSADSYDLTTVAQRLGLPGKTDDLKRLKQEHGGYDKIPQDDPEFRAYLEGDLRASAAVIAEMSRRYGPDPYVKREHRLAALAGTMTLNGFRVDQELLQERYEAGEKRKRDCLQVLHDGWGLPLTKMVTKGRGKAKTGTEEDVPSPLSTDAGRAWLEKFWTESGLDDPPRTQKTGKLSISADDMKAIAARRPDLAVVCNAIGTVVSTRTVYQTARDCLAEDGRVHPRISFRQASGRWSVTNPGLTVFGKRGGRHVERDIFLPDEGHVLLSFDLSQVDMRAMAWLSGDHAYRAMFAEGRDAHKEIAAQVGITRQDAKAIGHGWNYGLGPKKMIANGLDPDLVYAFIRGMEERFPQLIAWREQIREQGRAGMILDNGFGRRMACDPQRAYTVAPALMGQGGARDIMCTSLLRLPGETWPMLRVMVHDEIVLSVPRDQVVDVAQAVKAAMTWQLDDDLPVLCDMSGGANWGEASRK